MRKPLYIYGAGGLGKEVLATVRLLDEWEVKGFIDDHIEGGTMIHNLPVRDGVSWLRGIDDVAVVIGIGDPLIRSKIARQIPPGVVCPIIKHPAAHILDPETVVLGKGCILSAGAVLTTDIRVGDHVFINLNSTIGHDAVIGSYTSIMPSVNIAGAVNVGEAVLLGSGSNIRNGVFIGNGVRVGMGAVVIKNVNDNVTVVGVPAKPL
jgi:sugar O-acyltransferase (sialic acid O-acetyltransferase NeuD family)